MLSRLFIFATVMVFGPLFIEVYLYHPLIALEHDPVAIVPRTQAALAVAAGFLLLTVANKATTAVFGIVAVLAIAVGVVGTAIHLALHASSLVELATDPRVWLGGPPVLVPLTFAASGCLGLIALATPQRQWPGFSPVPVGRILEGLAAVCGIVAAVAGSLVEGGMIAFVALLAALALGAIGFVTEIAVGIFQNLPTRSA